MASDTFQVRVIESVGRTLELEITPTTAGGLADIACTRSFVLGLLAEKGAVRGAWTDKAWVEAHVDGYVKSTAILEIVGLEERSILDTHETYGIPLAHLQPHVRLAVELAPGVAAPFTAGDRFGTTAYDVWWEDPVRPAVPAFREPGCLEEVPADYLARVADRLRACLPAPWVTSDADRFGVDVGRVRFTGELSPMPAKRAYLPPLLQVRLTGALRDVDALAPAAKGKAKPRPPVAYFLWIVTDLFGQMVGGQRESPDALGERIAKLLEDQRAALAPHLDVPLEQLASALEGRLAPFPPKGLAFAPLRPLGELPEPPGFLFDFDITDAYWKRPLLLLAAGDGAAARAALAQAHTKWKAIPTAYKPLLAPLA